MAFGSILWLLLVCVEVCFGNNNTTTNHDGSTHSASFTSTQPSPSFESNSSTLPLPTPSIGLLSSLHPILTNSSTLPHSTLSTGPQSSLHPTFANSPTTTLPTSNVNGFFSSPHSSLIDTTKILIRTTSTAFLSTLDSNSIISTSPVVQSSPTLQSALHFNITVNSSASFVKSMPNGTSFPSNGSFEIKKPMAILQTGSAISSATPALFTSHSLIGSGFFAPSSSAQFRMSSDTKAVNGFMTVKSSFLSNVSTATSTSYGEESSTVQHLPTVDVPRQGSGKIFGAELRILNVNFTSELKNKSSSVFQKMALTVTSSIDSVMASSNYYKGCKFVEIRNDDGKIEVEITMGTGSSSDPRTTLRVLSKAVESGRVGNLTVDETYFTSWLKKDPQSRDSLLSGQLAGAALILFILVVLLLIICLGNFVDQPVFDERELFTEEVSMDNLGRDRDNQGSEDEEWKFDPLFAWSPRKSFDSKL